MNIYRLYVRVGTCCFQIVWFFFRYIDIQYGDLSNIEDIEETEDTTHGCHSIM